MAKPLKPSLHHWWPRAISEHWRDDAGQISMLRRNGGVTRGSPSTFGAIKDAHRINVGGPWDSTFEPQFNQADNEVSDLIEWLLTLEANRADARRPRLQQILPQPLPPERQLQLARTVASLIARSPRTREEIRRRTRYYREEFGMADPQPPRHLIAINQRALYDAYNTFIGRSGRWAVLLSDSTEFIFGDGFLHNFPASADGMLPGKKCVLPLLPTLAVVYMLPARHPSEPKLVTIKLDDEEVRFFNNALQAYANEFLFFRSQQPRLISAFIEGSHRQFQYHRHEWLESFLDDLSQYNLWGPGGSPGRSEDCFSESLRMDQWIERLVGDDTST